MRRCWMRRSFQATHNCNTWLNACLQQVRYSSVASLLCRIVSFVGHCAAGELKVRTFSCELCGEFQAKAHDVGCWASARRSGEWWYHGGTVRAILPADQRWRPVRHCVHRLGCEMLVGLVPGMVLDGKRMHQACLCIAGCAGRALAVRAALLAACAGCLCCTLRSHAVLDLIYCAPRMQVLAPRRACLRGWSGCPG